MAQLNFNNKSNGDYLTANEVNDIKQAVNDNEGYLSNGTVSGYFDSSNNFRYDYHIIPESNANYDLGSAEYKIRHLFLSRNSLWIGDENKIDASNGEIKTKKRNKEKLPYYITGVLNQTQEAVLTHASKGTVEELTLLDLEKFAQSIDPTSNISKIFPPETDANYEERDFDYIFSQNDYSKVKKSTLIYEKDLSGDTTPFQIDLDFETLQKNYFFNVGARDISSSTLTINVVKVPYDSATVDFPEGMQFSFKTTFLADATVNIPNTFTSNLLYDRDGYDQQTCLVSSVNNLTAPFKAEPFAIQLTLKHSYIHLGQSAWVHNVSVDHI
jgi:hypothetical protein